MWVSRPLVTRRTRLGPCVGLPVGEPCCLNLGALIFNNISNPAAQTENCLQPSAATNLFSQKHPPVFGRDGLSASGAGKCSGLPRAKVPPGFEDGFIQDLRPSKVL